MFRIANIEEVNKISRELGNALITEVSKHIRKNIIDSYIFVRYMGPKFVIVFSGVNSESAEDFVNDLKESTENLKIRLKSENYTVEELKQNKRIKPNRRIRNAEVSPTLNFVISMYYKGTGMETVLKKLEDYIDESDLSTNEVSNIY